MSWDTRDGQHGDDGFDPDACDGWRWCGVHGRPYYGRECAACGAAEFVARLKNETEEEAA